jgi:hypothetical protein
VDDIVAVISDSVRRAIIMAVKQSIHLGLFDELIKKTGARKQVFQRSLKHRTAKNQSSSVISKYRVDMQLAKG